MKFININKLQIAIPNHTYNTRYGNQLRIPKHNTNIIKCTVSLAGPKIWNSIATNIQNM